MNLSLQVMQFLPLDQILYLLENIRKNRLIIMKMIQKIHRNVFRPPENYYLYKKYYAPDVESLPEAHMLVTMIPIDCRPL